MASSSVPTVEVPDTQLSPMKPDNQLGVVDTQERDETSLTLCRSPLGEEDQKGENSAKDDVDGAGQGHGNESKEASHVLATPECEKADDVVPATQAYTDGSQGLQPLGVAEVKEHNGSGPEAAEAQSQLVRQDAFLEEMEEDAESLVAAALRCKKCGLEVRLEDAIIRGPHEMWCCECNALYTMLRRHQSWPPAAFAALSDNAQMAFFAKCKKDKEESRKSVFSYKTVRNHLLFTLTEEVTRQRKVSAGGTYLPLSVYEKKGYTIDPGFTWRNPSQWSEGLNDYVYLLAEVTVNEEEIHATIEREIIEAERSVKKRKGVDLEKAANEKVMALEDKKAKGNDDKKSTAAASDSTLVMDLVTDSESEGQCYFFFCASQS